MKPLDPDAESLLREWVEKADADLEVAQMASEAAAEALTGARWLGPFGVEMRYPGDAVEMLPGDEVKAIELASQVKQVVLAILATR